MFTLMKLALQVVFKPYSLGEKASCRKFLENVLTLVKPMAKANNISMDDAIIVQVERILASDALFDYFYQLIADQFSTNEVLFESADEETVITLCENVNSARQTGENLPESVNPILVISIATQLISLINALKKSRIE
jgi:hypothetical protein